MANTSGRWDLSRRVNVKELKWLSKKTLLLRTHERAEQVPEQAWRAKKKVPVLFSREGKNVPHFFRACELAVSREGLVLAFCLCMRGLGFERPVTGRLVIWAASSVAFRRNRF